MQRNFLLSFLFLARPRLDWFECLPLLWRHIGQVTVDGGCSSGLQGRVSNPRIPGLGPGAGLMGEKAQARRQQSPGLDQSCDLGPGPGPGAAQNASRVALWAGDPFGELRARGMLNAHMDPGAAEKVGRASTRRLCAPFQVWGLARPWTRSPPRGCPLWSGQRGG